MKDKIHTILQEIAVDIRTDKSKSVNDKRIQLQVIKTIEEEVDEMNTKKKTNKEIAIDRLFEALRGQGDMLRESNALSDYDKLEQVDVILNTMKFLTGYDENIAVLDKVARDKARKAKFANSREER